MFELVDSHERKFVYLRLSVTDRCNFRCLYCLPNGYEKASGCSAFDGEPELSIQEIRRLVRGFAGLGVTKVRLTGGEPTVRRDIVEIAHAVSEISGIERVAITTNGNRLAELARPLRDAGVRALNISLDSLSEKRFGEITGTSRFNEVLKGIEAVLDGGFESVKINAVLLRDCNDDEVPQFMSWIRDRPVSVRFIELMRTGKNRECFDKHHLTAGAVQFRLQREGWEMSQRGREDGPAVVYRHPDYRGTIGLIAPYSPDFCKSCNRLRVSSRGGLRLCLFGERDQSLREYLQDDSQRDRLERRIRSLVTEKPVRHFLREGKYGNTWNLAGIGG